MPGVPAVRPLTPTVSGDGCCGDSYGAWGPFSTRPTLNGKGSSRSRQCVVGNEIFARKWSKRLLSWLLDGKRPNYRICLVAWGEATLLKGIWRQWRPSGNYSAGFPGCFEPEHATEFVQVFSREVLGIEIPLQTAVPYGDAMATSPEMAEQIFLAGVQMNEVVPWA